MKLNLSDWLKTETVFHAVAIAVILHALVYKQGVGSNDLAAAAAIAALGRVTPTEKVDERLDIPLDGSKKEPDSEDSDA
ncbi:MAG: hypothetical protein KME27_10710 [Lyngbya sp. HA4199-MV5]|nr:hypothetical protein [Lyngbya sp. HA4199-MV5]